MKKLFTLFLMLAASVGTMFAADKVQIGDLYYYLDAENKTAEVTYGSLRYSGSIIIPESVVYNAVTYSVTSIGAAAFYECTSLTSATIPNSVTSIGNWAFKGCTGLTSPVYNSHLFAYMPTSYSGAYTILNGIESIVADAFENCTSLTSVTIPNSVTSIGDWAFKGCTSLTSVTIPNSVTSIGNGAFDGCISLTSATISNSVTSIGNWAFRGCSNLTSPVYNEHVFAFMPTSYSGAYTIPNGIESIVVSAFQYCTGLTSVTIPNSVTSIGAAAFYECTSLTSVTIPNSVTSIGDGAFYKCYLLTSITCEAEIPPTLEYYDKEGEDAIFSNPPFYDQDSLYVLAESVDVYKAAKGWKGFKNILPISAKETEVVTPTVEPEVTSVDIIWPVVTGAASYELVIKDANGNVICRLTFNEKGQLTSIAFNAPGRNESQQTQSAGFAFSVTGLEPGTLYNYSIIAKNASGATLSTKTGTFTTKVLESLDQINQQPGTNSQKLIKDGQVFILRGNKTYTTMGQEVR